MALSDAVDQGARARGLGVKVKYVEDPPPKIESIGVPTSRNLVDSLNGDNLVDSLNGDNLVESP